MSRIAAIYNDAYPNLVRYATGAAATMLVMLALLASLGWLAPAGKRQDRLPIIIDNRYVVDRDTCAVIEVRK